MESIHSARRDPGFYGTLFLLTYSKVGEQPCHCDLYNGYAASIGADLPPAQVVVSQKQRLVLREICMESLFVE